MPNAAVVPCGLWHDAHSTLYSVPVGYNFTSLSSALVLAVSSNHLAVAEVPVVALNFGSCVAVGYAIDIGWSSARFCVRFVILPSSGNVLLPGDVEMPLNVQPWLVGVALNPPEPGAFLNASNAIVPSWQDRHAKDIPPG